MKSTWKAKNRYSVMVYWWFSCYIFIMIIFSNVEHFFKVIMLIIIFWIIWFNLISLFLFFSEVIEAIHLSDKGLCLTRPVLYTVAIVGSLAQVAFFICCLLLFLFVRKCRRIAHQTKSGYLSSRSSVSSKQELCPRS